jgi:protein-S-isoprenylcysteine O-methyltransferase
MLDVDIMGFCWIVFLAYWIVSSVHVKKDLDQRVPAWLSLVIRLFAAGGMVLLLSALPVLRGAQASSWFDPAIQAAGAALCVLGVAVAIWARANLGANWSRRPATKQGHELVTSGPYRFVRHPIYFGMLVAMLGTMLIASIPGLVVLATFGLIAIRRIRVEERLMMRLFPDAYAAYQQRTKALIPFVI